MYFGWVFTLSQAKLEAFYGRRIDGRFESRKQLYSSGDIHVHPLMNDYMNN